MKLLILNADTVEQEFELKDKFVFLITDDILPRVYHVDTSDGNMWSAKPDLKNLGEGHQAVIKKALGL